MDAKRAVRIVLLGVCVVAVAVLAEGFVAAAGSESVTDLSVEGTMPADTDGLTVITTQARDAVIKNRRDGMESALLVVDREGRVVYRNTSYDNYWDVDPDPSGEATVTYVATEVVPRSACVATEACVRMVIEELNLTTGRTERLYTHRNVLPMDEIGNGHSSRWHDVDRLDESQFVVADLFHDRVFVVDTTTGIVTWQWNAESAFPPAGGGSYPDDWTHVNDVERLPDGRFMISLRNQDTVAFLDRDGEMADWRLGSDGRHDVLFEQHNPDYIPAARGGPAVVVADSENNRIVEYQRVDGEWRQTWVWQDLTLRWPRDADRLPNGHTLVTDSRGGRVVEIDENNQIVWRVTVRGGYGPYEAERLGTGDESAGGESAARLGLTSRTVADTTPDREPSPLLRLAVRIVPPRVRNVIAFVAPSWMTVIHIGAALGLAGVVAGWSVLEYRWSSVRLALRTPVDGTVRAPITLRRSERDGGRDDPDGDHRAD